MSAAMQSSPDSPAPLTANGTHKAPSKARAKTTKKATTKKPAATVQPAPIARRTIGPAADVAAPTIIPNVVVSTFGGLTERLADLLTQRAVLDGRIAEVRGMMATGKPRARSPGRPKAMGPRKRRARAKVKASAPAFREAA